MRLVLAGVLIGLAAFAVGTANAEPSQPGPTTTSTSDDLADMVMGVIEHGSVPVPTTTPVPAPPG
jgi:hypothetical protein